MRYHFIQPRMRDFISLCVMIRVMAEVDICKALRSVLERVKVATANRPTVCNMYFECV